LRLIDTAGQRTTADLVESEGVRRAQEAASRADLILYLVDASKPQQEDTFPAPLPLPHQHLVAIAHKSDLGVHPDHQTKLPVSSKTGQGVKELEAAIQQKLRGGRDLGKQGWLTVNARQAAALQRAQAALTTGLAALQRKDPPELASSHLREALQAIGEVVGLATNEDILDSLFKKFCIGK
jgi:tRNA modification GTPase